MRMINAHWERRNLGVGVAELELETTDGLDEIDAAESTAADVGYLVLKTPVSRSDLLFGLPARGWQFVEAQESLLLRRDDFRVPAALARFDAASSWRLAETAEEAERILAPYRFGSFDTDRVALDPVFGPKIAGTRYYNWATDVFRGGGEIFECLYRDRSIGSFVFQPEANRPRVNRAILGAMLPEYQERGFGTLFFKKNMDAAFDRSYDEIRTQISSNNPTVFRLWLAFGAELLETRYVYVKHRASFSHGGH